MTKEYIERGRLLELETFLQDADGFECSAVLSVDIRSAKAADVVEVKHSRWVDGSERFGAKPGEYRVCGRCNICFPRDDRIVPPAYWQWCPNCHAKMDGE